MQTKRHNVRLASGSDLVSHANLYLFTVNLSTTNNMSHVIVSFPSNSASFAQDAHHPLPSNHEVVNLEKSEGSQIIDGKESTGSQDNLQSQAQHKRERECTPVQEPISKRRKLVIEPLYNALPKVLFTHSKTLTSTHQTVHP